MTADNNFTEHHFKKNPITLRLLRHYSIKWIKGCFLFYRVNKKDLKHGIGLNALSAFFLFHTEGNGSKVAVELSPVLQIGCLTLAQITLGQPLRNEMRFFYITILCSHILKSNTHSVLQMGFAITNVCS